MSFFKQTLLQYVSNSIEHLRVHKLCSSTLLFSLLLGTHGLMVIVVLTSLLLGFTA